MPIPPVNSVILLCANPLGKMAHARRLSKRSGFTLVELLLVIGIMGLMLALSIPALSSLKGGSDLSKSASDIQGILENARTRAMLQNTYVYVGFFESDGVLSQNTRPAPAGTGRVWVGVVATKDGLSSNVTSTNLIPIGKIHYFDNLHLTNSAPSFTPSNALTQSPIYLSNSVSPLSSIGWPVDTQKTVTVFSGGALCFNPSGTVNVTTNWVELPQLIQLALVPAKGNALLSSSRNAAVLQIDGVTGAVRIYRP